MNLALASEVHPITNVWRYCDAAFGKKIPTRHQETSLEDMLVQNSAILITNYMDKLSFSRHEEQNRQRLLDKNCATNVNCRCIRKGKQHQKPICVNALPLE